MVSSILARVNATKPDVKVITFNHEGIFNKTEIDRSVVKTFVDGRNDMDYPIYIDSHRVAVQGKGRAVWPLQVAANTRFAGLFEPGQNLSIPLGDNFPIHESFLED